jgi:hypothetical protein
MLPGTTDEETNSFAQYCETDTKANVETNTEANIETIQATYQEAYQGTCDELTNRIADCRTNGHDYPGTCLSV